MATPLDPQLPHHMPWFITAPGQTDGLFLGMTVFLILCVLGVGLLYLTLHALPEKRVHASTKTQIEIVAVLSVLALFTHNNLLWIIALVVALVQLPDFSTPITSMARSLERLANRGMSGPRRERTVKSAPLGSFAAQRQGPDQSPAPRRAERV